MEGPLLLNLDQADTYTGFGLWVFGLSAFWGLGALIWIEALGQHEANCAFQMPARGSYGNPGNSTGRGKEYRKVLSHLPSWCAPSQNGFMFADDGIAAECLGFSEI